MAPPCRCPWCSARPRCGWSGGQQPCGGPNSCHHQAVWACVPPCCYCSRPLTSRATCYSRPLTSQDTCYSRCSEQQQPHTRGRCLCNPGRSGRSRPLHTCAQTHTPTCTSAHTCTPTPPYAQTWPDAGSGDGSSCRSKPSGSSSSSSSRQCCRASGCIRSSSGSSLHHCSNTYGDTDQAERPRGCSPGPGGAPPGRVVQCRGPAAWQQCGGGGCPAFSGLPGAGLHGHQCAQVSCCAGCHDA